MNVQIFDFYANPRYSLVILCSMDFVWGPSCFSQKLFFSLSASFPQGPNNYSFIRWVTGWGCVPSSCPNSGLDAFPVSLPGQSLVFLQLFFFPLKLFKQSMNTIFFFKLSFLYIFKTVISRNLPEVFVIKGIIFFFLFLSSVSLTMLALF